MACIKLIYSCSKYIRKTSRSFEIQYNKYVSVTKRKISSKLNFAQHILKYNYHIRFDIEEYLIIINKKKKNMYLIFFVCFYILFTITRYFIKQ